MANINYETCSKLSTILQYEIYDTNIETTLHPGILVGLNRFWYVQTHHVGSDRVGRKIVVSCCVGFGLQGP